MPYRDAAFLERLYAPVADRLKRTDPPTAEVLKLVNNAWHALKVAFANEVARTTLPIGVDPFAVMRLLCADTRLNTSAAYLRPGLPFGGACLVKDVASIQTHARRHAVDAPLLGSILRSLSIERPSRMHAVAKLLHGPPLPHQIDQHPAGFDQPPVQIGQLPHEQIRPTHRLHRHTGVLPEAVDVDRPQQRIPRPMAIGIQMPLPFPQLLLERRHVVPRRI